MSESDLGAVSDVDLGGGGDADAVEDVDLGDDALDDLINQAESLMNDLGDKSALSPNDKESNGKNEGDGDAKNNKPPPAVSTTTTSDVQIPTTFSNEFSIDDDDDDNNKNAAPSAVSSTIAADEDHPLSLTSPTAATSGTPTASAGQAPGAAFSSTVNQTYNNMMNTMTGVGMGSATNNGTPTAHGGGGGQNAVTIDAFKQQTSRFASTLSSMAQRGMAQVQAVAGPPGPVNVIGAPPPQHQQQTPKSSSSPSHFASNIYGGGHGGAHGSSFVASLAAKTQQNQQYGGASPMSNGVNTTPKSPTPTNHNATPSSSNNAGASSSSLSQEEKTRLIKEHVGDLFPGERIIMFLANLLHVGDTSGTSFSAAQSHDGSMWCCIMTYYRIVLFSTRKATTKIEPPPGWDPACWPEAPSVSHRLVEMPLAAMDKVEKTVYQAGGSSYMGIVVLGKDCGRVIRFTTPSYADTGRAFESLNTYAFPGRRNIGYLFAFESKRAEVMASIQPDPSTGENRIMLPPHPKRFDPVTEYPRILQATSITQSPWTVWSSINNTYMLSPSYPGVLVGPASLDETMPESQGLIRQCAAFRSEQRLPCLTWCGPGGSSIWRASQPKVGLQGNRSSSDEIYIKHISESARGANAMADPPPVYPRSILQQLTGDYTYSGNVSGGGTGGMNVNVAGVGVNVGGSAGKEWVPEPGCGLKILDLRPRSAAMANRTAGYGYENTSNYPGTTLQFCNVQNIHAVRDSYQKLCSVCNNESTSDVNWNALVEDTKWLGHIRTILAASWEAAYWVHVWRLPVLLHCSHGWDRTSQASALAQLLLDPYYRTRHGFGVLVEKDFMSFGHPFHLRSAHGEGRNDTKNSSQSSSDEGQISPIFLQFVDCVYQIVQLYPNAFEFNTKYLLELSFHIYSCRFGNMLCDTEREREVGAGIRQRCFSLWDFLDSKPELVNPEYASRPGVILMPLPTLLRNVKLWEERHCYFSPKPTSFSSIVGGTSTGLLQQDNDAEETATTS